MKIILITKDGINKYTLPENINEDYWITKTVEKDKVRLIKISSDEGQLELVSNNYARIIDTQYLQQNRATVVGVENDKYLPKVKLEENHAYVIAVDNSSNKQIIYYFNEKNESFSHFNITNTNQFYIGSNEANEIVYKNNFVADAHAMIEKREGSWYIENLDSDFGTFVNNAPIVVKSKKLFNGDIVFIMGLRIVVLNNTLYINNPNGTVEMKKEYFLPIEKPPVMLSNKYKEDELNNSGKEEYFVGGPRINYLCKPDKEKITIDPPPELNNKKERPMWLTVGSSLVMELVMLVSLITVIQGSMSGTSSPTETVVAVVSAVLMLIGMVVFPIINEKYDDRRRKRYIEKRKKRYTEYLNKKVEDIEKIKEKHRTYMFKNYLSSEECERIIYTRSTRLWERGNTDSDFLAIRLGTGIIPFDLEIAYPEKGFSMEDDELIEELNRIVKQAQGIGNVPVTVSLQKNNIAAIISKDNRLFNNYIKNIIIQLIALHSCTNLKIVAIVNKETSAKWEYLKLLPHLWDDTKRIRFFADNDNDINELSLYLKEQLNNRTQNTEGSDNKQNTVYNPYYLIITDNYEKIENLEFIRTICESNKKLGFSLLCVTDELYKLPKECQLFVNVDENKGVVFDAIKEKSIQIGFKFDPIKIIFFENINKILSNIPIKIYSKDATLLPSNYTFLEMYEVGNIEQLNILDRWKNNDSTLTLKAPIGIDNQGSIINLDIHEKAHGPHGLIAGATGSGKSELIITYLLSLALNYNPNDVNFLLIDYKGGGLAGAFEKADMKIPHLVGTITNIDRSALQRSFISIQSEIRKRQILFNEARDKVGDSTIDIYKYQKLYHEGIIDTPIPHLLIVCDEFAELKQQQEDFMDDLISVSRIGRSLGVHLILATQKPAGIVSEQIRSNSKFAICLKVQDTSDSQDMINRKDAAYLKNAGQFYMLVGNDEFFTLGQSRLGRSKLYSR